MELKVEVSEEKIEKLIRGVMENYPEASSMSLQCVEFDYKNCLFKFWDVEEEGEDGREVYHDVDYPKLRKGFETLMNIALGRVEGERFFIAGWDPVGFFDPDSWGDWICTWDAGAADGLVQCAVFGEVIYG